MNLPVMSFNKETLSRFNESIRKEWIVTNGLGGYASSTVLGVNTRKYHGLLVAALHPPGDRRVCLAKLDEEVNVGNETYRVGANEFQDGVFPQGYLFLKEFSVSPFPKCVFMIQNVEVRKTVFMPYEKNAVVAVYKVLNGNGVDVKFRVFPLVNWRHFHSVTDRWRMPTDFVQEQQNKQISLRFRFPQSVLVMRSTGGRFVAEAKWVEKLFYREESARGESCLDDCYQPGFFEVTVRANKSETFAIIAVADETEVGAGKVLDDLPLTMYDVDGLYAKEIERQTDFLTHFYESHSGLQQADWLSWVVLATDQFIVRSLVEGQKSVIAGYHWFESWGRDTFVSLPGLMLVTGRFEDARRVFLGFKAYCENGLIPNYIPDRQGQPAYNTVDASLWFVNAILQYVKYTGDWRFVQDKLWNVLKQIIDSHVRGTSYNIRMDVDGLLSHGAQLTWMDVAINGQAVTPREGKAVEVQALWHNALRTVELLAIHFGENDEATRFGQLAEHAKRSFDKFWNAERNCLFDVVGDDGKDGSLRPNQVIAAALDWPMLDGVKCERVVDVVQQELLTPFGLRSLARNDSRYVGIYAGDRNSRDRAYHNGTVWAWLMGPFVTAFLKAKGYTEFRRECALNLVSPLLKSQLFEAGLGSVSEVFDGEAPHMPRGCIAQAWSVAEPLRAYVEDITQCRPKCEKDIMKP